MVFDTFLIWVNKKEKKKNPRWKAMFICSDKVIKEKKKKKKGAHDSRMLLVFFFFWGLIHFIICRINISPQIVSQ